MIANSYSKKKLLSLLLVLFVSIVSWAQTGVVTGKVTDKDGVGIPNVTITVAGKAIDATDNQGNFKVTVDKNATLVFSSVGFDSKTVSLDGKSSIDVSMTSKANSSQGEVVVIGYGTARRKDVTGAVTSVTAKNFNKGPVGAPDQLIQGKVAGVQVIANSGAPGGGTTVRIRGNSSLRAGNTPLFVIDGVPLSNTNTRPDIGLTDVGGGTPSGNPLNFINPNDIASMEVLKDASAAAIYGSRGSNGVVLITTKKGQSGAAKVDFSTSIGFSSILKKLKVLTGDEYRTALGQAGLPTTVSNSTITTGNYGGNSDALASILRKGVTQNYSVGISAGTENARYRLSLGYLNQDGIVKKTDYKKYAANFSSTIKMLDNKRLSVDFNVISSQSIEHIAPISNNAGFKGSLIGQALQWNPTKSLYKTGTDSALIEYGSDNINPLAYSQAYFDNAKVTTILASVSPSYKITNDLEFKTLVSVNYSTGLRKQYTTAYININDIAIDRTVGNPTSGKGGEANVSQNELVTKQITNTLSYNKDISQSVSLNAVVGHEYIKTNFGGNSQYARRFLPTNEAYYLFMSSSEPSTRQTNGFQDPTVELQSFFGRAIFNINDKYVVTGTVRADGSSKFGKNNRYGIFPSIAASWNVSKENFMKNLEQISNLKLRLSYGTTGNQEFPAGASQLLYTLSGNPGNFSQSQFFNPDLKWESTKTFNVGLEFGILSNKVNVTMDYFKRNTINLLFPREAADPVTPNSAVKWVNLPNANIDNSGLEIALNSTIIDKKDFILNVGLNLTFLKNKLKDFIGELPTGEVNGQGVSGAYSQLIKSGYALNTFYLKRYLGIDKTTGISSYEEGDKKFFLGTANPTKVLGFTINASYKKVSLEMAMNGAFGHFVYNNTANATLSYNNLGKRNIGKREYDIATRDGEKVVNPTSASNRYLEKGNYLKMSNLTLTYSIGSIGKFIRGANVFMTGQNLFVITKYSGFDPEVNTSKPLNNIPSFGLEYTPYPTSKTINFGINFSL
jgi:TonB-dependent starch-binding outer membrane protein SusC